MAGDNEYAKEKEAVGLGSVGEAAHDSKRHDASPKPKLTLNYLKNNEKNKKFPSLLDMDETEKRQIKVAKIIETSSWLAGPVGTAVAYSAGIAAAAQVCSLGAVGLVGAGIGYYRAKKQIKSEKEKVIQLNKELFLMFNVAADKKEELNKLMAKKEDEKHMREKSKEYYDLITQIHFSVASPNEISRDAAVDPQDKEQKGAHYSKEVYRMDGIINEYIKHRKITMEGCSSNEFEYWDLLKADNKIFSADEKLINTFINFSSKENVIIFFSEEQEKELHAYLTQGQAFKDGLDAQEFGEIALGLENSEKRKKIVQIDSALKTLSNDLHDYIKKDVKQKQNDAEEAIKKIEAAFENIHAKYRDIVKTHLKDDKASQPLKDTWIELEKIVKAICSSIKSEHTILIESTTSINTVTKDFFGTHGSFRQFWRSLPDKPPYEIHNESIPLNFEQNIHRGGSIPAFPSWKAATHFGPDFLVVGAGLYGTGNALYAAAIALGAVAFSSTVVGAIVIAAIALAFAIAYIICSYKSQQTQSHRDALHKKLREHRIAIFKNTKLCEKEKVAVLAAPVLPAATSGAVFDEKGIAPPAAAAAGATVIATASQPQPAIDPSLTASGLGLFPATEKPTSSCLLPPTPSSLQTAQGRGGINF